MKNDLISRSGLWTDIMMLPHNGDIISSEEVEQAIVDAPAVDAVAVVRCGECAHRVYKEINDCEIGGCELFGVALPCDFYCANGKRRVDDG